jgi:hypothetical protein
MFDLIFSAPVDVIVIIALVAIIAVMVLGRIETRLRGEAACLRAAEKTAREFFGLADRVLANEHLPDRVRPLVLALVNVVRDRKRGQVAFDHLLDVMTTRDMHSGATFDAELKRFRAEHPELYEETTNALRSAFMVLMLTHGPDNSRVQLECSAASPAMYELTKELTRDVAEKVNGFGGPAHA